MKTVFQIRSQAAQHRNPWLFHPEKDMVENASVGRMRTVTEAQLKNAKLSGVGKDRRRERKLKVKSLFHSANTQTGTLGRRLSNQKTALRLTNVLFCLQ